MELEKKITLSEVTQVDKYGIYSLKCGNQMLIDDMMI